MSETKTIRCAACSKGCSLAVVTEGRTVLSVMGNACGDGTTYAQQEVLLSDD